MPAPTDRYEPLPGLLSLPGHFLRKLPPRGRLVAAGVGLLLLVGAAAGAIALVPQITESKREHAAAEREARREAAVRERERLVREGRPRRGRVAAGAPIAAVEAAITRDARARAASGELANPARRTSCRRLGRDAGRLLLNCTAITSEAASTENASGVTVGYSYRAALDDGRYAFCKTSGRPAVGFTDRQLAAVELSPACGG